MTTSRQEDSERPQEGAPPLHPSHPPPPPPPEPTREPPVLPAYTAENLERENHGDVIQAAPSPSPEQPRTKPEGSEYASSYRPSDGANLTPSV